MEKKVKGSLLAIQARFIRANKDRDWDKYLKPEDWEIINASVLPSLWHPLETFQRGGVAIFEIIAGGDLEVIRSMGKFSVDQLAKDIYKVISQAGKAQELTFSNIRTALSGAASDYDIRNALKELEERNILGHTVTKHNRFVYRLWPSMYS